MLSKEENERFTRVGPGTPMGALLRRYWHPVAPVQELTSESPTKILRVLGEDLVLFKDKSGRVGCLADHCAHRGASLLYGRVEERGIACAYHGWLYDTSGSCLECPAEPAGSMFHLTVKQTAYPVRRLAGLYWIYMGPDPAPEIPRYDVWVRRDLQRRIVAGPNLECNWFQAIENGVDSFHASILHQDAGGRAPASTTRGVLDEIDHIDSWPVSFGVQKRYYYTSGWWRQHPWIFPNIVCLHGVTQHNTPIDDTHVLRFRLYFEPRAENSEGPDSTEEVNPLEYGGPVKEPPHAQHPVARYDMRKSVEAQDFMAWETQGPIADRSTERLATSDRWIVELRDVFRENLRRVEEGLDPLGVVRDPAHGVIETELSSSSPERMAARGAAARGR